MHRCLLITEVTHLICTELDNACAKKSLARLAQTCLALHEPALDALWYELHDLSPLVRCMPPDLWNKSNRWEKNLVFQRPIMPTDWTRFITHAGRVRTFHHGHNYRGPIYRALSMAATEEVLLPKLKELRWHTSRREDDTFPFIRLFLGPHIERLHVSLTGDPSIRLSFLYNLHLRYPSLTHIHLIMPDPDQTLVGSDDYTIAFINALSRVVCGWSRLRHLSVPNLSPVAFRHVASLPTLEQLTLTDVTEDTPMALSRFHTIPLFPCLRELDLTCNQTTFSIGLVEAMSSTSLTSITIQTHCNPAPLEWEDLFNALQGHCCHSSVTSITIKTGLGDDEYGSIIPIHLKSLFVFSNLTNVTLFPGNPFDLDDTILKDMAQAWPRIKSLLLDGEYEEEYHPRVTILGLVPLAEYCPELQMLTITFDASSVPLPTAGSPGVTSETLKELNVLRSPLREPEWVAEFLYDIFPRAGVKSCQWYWRYEKGWIQVRDLMYKKSPDYILVTGNCLPNTVRWRSLTNAVTINTASYSHFGT